MLLTQAEFAREFGVRLKEVWRWENQERVPRLCHQRTLYAIEQRIKALEEEEATRKAARRF